MSYYIFTLLYILEYRQFFICYLSKNDLALVQRFKLGFYNTSLFWKLKFAKGYFPYLGPIKTKWYF